MFQYDNISVRGLMARVSIFPGLQDRFDPGVLSRLYAEINTDDTFDECSLRQRTGATFEGERITMDVTPRSLRMTFRSFASIHETKERVSDFLTVTRRAFEATPFVYLPARVRVWAVVPDDGSRDVGTTVSRKLLGRSPKGLGHLPGSIAGSGVEIHGHADEFGYTVTVAPFLPQPGNLFLQADLSFYWREPDDLSNDVAGCIDAIQVAYDTLTGDVTAFGQEFLP